MIEYAQRFLIYLPSPGETSPFFLEQSAIFPGCTFNLVGLYVLIFLTLFTYSLVKRYFINSILVLVQNINNFGIATSKFLVLIVSPKIFRMQTTLKEKIETSTFSFKVLSVICILIYVFNFISLLVLPICLPFFLISALGKLFFTLVTLILIGLPYLIHTRTKLFVYTFVWLLFCLTSINGIAIVEIFHEGVTFPIQMEKIEWFPIQWHLLHLLIITIPFLIFLNSPYVVSLSQLKGIPFLTRLKIKVLFGFRLLIGAIFLNFYLEILEIVDDCIFYPMLYSYMPMAVGAYYGGLKDLLRNALRMPFRIRKFYSFFSSSDTIFWDARLLLIASVPFLNLVPGLVPSYALSSIIFDRSFAIKGFLLFVIVITFVVCSKEVQFWVKTRYGDRALRILSWNTSFKNFIYSTGAVISATALYMLSGTLQRRQAKKTYDFEDGIKDEAQVSLAARLKRIDRSYMEREVNLPADPEVRRALWEQHAAECSDEINRQKHEETLSRTPPPHLPLKITVKPRVKGKGTGGRSKINRNKSKKG